MEFPQKLDKMIARSGKTQVALAEETGIDQSAISAMTRGKRRPYMDQAFKLARAIGVSLDFLADDSLDEPPRTQTVSDSEILRIARYLGRAEAMRRLLAADISPGWEGEDLSQEPGVESRGA